MKAAKVVLIAGLLLVLVAGTGIAYLAINLDNHRTLLESGVSKSLGRRIEVRDGMGIAWSMQPRFVLNGVWVANPEWAGEAYFARVERLSLQLDLWALLSGRIEIQQLTLENADVGLETGQDGSTNWTFGSKLHTDAGFDIDIDSLQVRNSRLRYQPAGGIEYHLDVAELGLMGLRGKEAALTAQVRYLDIPVTVEAKFTSDVSSGAEGWPFRGRVETGDATLDIGGRALAPFVLSGGEIEFDLQAQDLRSLKAFLRQENLPQGPFRMAARLAIQPGHYRLHTIRGSMDFPDLIRQVAVTGGEATMSADGALSSSLQGTWHEVPATLAFTLAGTGGQDGVVPHNLDLAATLAGLELKARGQLTGSAADAGWDLDLDLQAADLTGLDPILAGDWRPDTPVTVTTRVKKSAQSYALTGLSARFGDSEYGGDLQLALGGERPRLAGKLLANRLDLGAFAAMEQPTAVGGDRPHWSDTPLPKVSLDAFDVDMTLNVREVVAGKLRADDTKARMLLENGRLQLKSIDLSLPGLPITGQATFDTGPQRPTLDLALRSERIELPRALHIVNPSARVTGSVRKVSLRLTTAGATPRELIAHAKGELEAISARLGSLVGKGAKANEIALANARFQTRPKEPVRLRTELEVAGRSYALDLVSGPLSELIWDKKPWKTIEVAARSEIDNQPVEILGQVGPWSALIAGRDLGLGLSVRHHGMEAQLNGILDRLDRFPGHGLSLRLSGPTLARLGDVIGTNLPESEPFEIDSRIEGSDRSLSMTGLKSTIGDSSISGEVRIIAGPKTRVEATLDSNLLDLTPHLPAGVTTLDDATSDLTTKLQLDVLHALDGELRWSVRQLRIRDIGVSDLNLDASLDAGHLRLRMDAGQGRLTADVELKPKGALWQLTLKHKGKLDLGWLIDAEEGVGTASLAPVALDVHVTGVGKTAQELMASADGHLEMLIGAGRINQKIAVLPLTGIFVTLLDSISASEKQEQGTKLECAVIKLDIADGIATSAEGLAMQTDKLNILGAGTLNLMTGEIDFQFKTVNRGGLGINLLGIADRFIRITGTLYEPEAALDPKGLLIHGGGALATGGVTLLLDDLTRRLTSFGNPCDTVLEQDKDSRSKSILDNPAG